MILECTLGILVNREMVISFVYKDLPVTLFIKNPQKYPSGGYITEHNTQVVKYLQGQGRKCSIDFPSWIFERLDGGN
jgi:hypothetical protein